MVYQKKKKIIKLRMIDDSNLYSEKKLDSINYFEGKAYYARWQDSSLALNSFEIRQSFLLKTHNSSAREKFLKNFNHRNN
jgi:hypothetical protein